MRRTLTRGRAGDGRQTSRQEWRSRLHGSHTAVGRRLRDDRWVGGGGTSVGGGSAAGGSVSRLTGVGRRLAAAGGSEGGTSVGGGSADGGSGGSRLAGVGRRLRGDRWVGGGTSVGAGRPTADPWEPAHRCRAPARGDRWVDRTSVGAGRPRRIRGSRLTGVGRGSADPVGPRRTSVGGRSAGGGSVGPAHRCRAPAPRRPVGQADVGRGGSADGGSWGQLTGVGRGSRRPVGRVEHLEGVSAAGTAKIRRGQINGAGCGSATGSYVTACVAVTAGHSEETRGSMRRRPAGERAEPPLPHRNSPGAIRKVVQFRHAEMHHA
jgi:hypothetical protein